MNKCLAIAVLAISLLPAPVLALDWDLETELNDLDLDVEVLDVELDEEGLHLEAGAIAVMVTNYDEREVGCQLMPGPTESDPGLETSPVHLILPGERGVLRMAGEFGDDTLNARLVCQPEGEERAIYE